MLGLGLALSIAKKTLGDAIDGLLSTLKGRATYYENGSASKSTIKAIDNADILDKATILLTPTATSDARVHSVKTYTGDEFITNGDFNGDASGWNLVNAAWQQGSGNGEVKLTKPSSGNSAVYQLGHTYTEGMTLRYKFKIIDYSGSPNIRIDGYSGSNPLNTSTTFPASSGDVDITIKTDRAGSGVFLYITGGSTGDYIVLDDISVVDVSSDFDFDRASSATRINSSGLVQDMQSITDPELVLNGDFEELGSELVTNGDFATDSDWSKSTGWSIADGVASFNTTTNGSITQSGYANSKTYKVSIDVVSYVRGNPFVAIGQGSQYTIPNSIGTHIIYVTSGSVDTILRIYSGQFGVGGEGSIDNVSVQQVDPNDRWSLSSTFEIDNGKLHCVSDGSYQYAYQANAFVVGNTYKITFDVIDYTSGSIRVRPSGQSGYTAASANGTYTQYFTATDTTLAIERGSACDLYVDNVSVKDITFSTDVDLARINYDSNGDNGHILLEPTSTNLITYSEDFEQWTKEANIEVTDNSITSPNGTQNAAKLQLTGSSSGTDGKIKFSVSPSATTHTFSVFAKKGNHDYIYIWMNISGGTNIARWIDLDDGSVSGSGGTATVTTTSFSNDWWKIEYTFDATNLSNITLEVADDGTSTGTGGDNIYVWGAQLEALSYATSYIPNHGTAAGVTRAAETLTGSGNSTLINSTEGVLYAEIAALADDLTRRIITITDGTLNNIVKLEYKNVSNQIEAVLYDGDTECLILHTLSDETEFNKIAFKYKQDDFSLFVNGIKVGTDTSGDVFAPNTLNDLSFYQGSINNFYGKCKALAVFNEALSDTQLTNLTS